MQEVAESLASAIEVLFFEMSLQAKRELTTIKREINLIDFIKFIVFKFLKNRQLSIGSADYTTIVFQKYCYPVQT